VNSQSFAFKRKNTFELKLRVHARIKGFVGWVSMQMFVLDVRVHHVLGIFHVLEGYVLDNLCEFALILPMYI
jgi:hypothetical protein